MGERETYVVMASMWSRSRSALARRFATILLGALCMYRIRIARSLLLFFFFASPQAKFSKVCGKIFIVVAKARSRALSLSRELSPSSAPNVSHSLRENLYEKEMRRPITVL